eukprot:142536-Prorocentrum_minimum.AAC.1
MRSEEFPPATHRLAASVRLDGAYVALSRLLRRVRLAIRRRGRRARPPGHLRRLIGRGAAEYSVSRRVDSPPLVPPTGGERAAPVSCAVAPVSRRLYSVRFCGLGLDTVVKPFLSRSAGTFNPILPPILYGHCGMDR